LTNDRTDINLPSPAQWALQLIEKTSQRQKELKSGKEVRNLPGEDYEIEDADVEDV